MKSEIACNLHAPTRLRLLVLHQSQTTVVPIPPARMTTVHIALPILARFSNAALVRLANSFFWIFFCVPWVFIVMSSYWTFSQLACANAWFSTAFARLATFLTSLMRAFTAFARLAYLCGLTRALIRFHHIHITVPFIVLLLLVVWMIVIILGVVVIINILVRNIFIVIGFVVIISNNRRQVDWPMCRFVAWSISGVVGGFMAWFVCWFAGWFSCLKQEDDQRDTVWEYKSENVSISIAKWQINTLYQYPTGKLWGALVTGTPETPPSPSLVGNGVLNLDGWNDGTLSSFTNDGAGVPDTKVGRGVGMRVMVIVGGRLFSVLPGVGELDVVSIRITSSWVAVAGKARRRSSFMAEELLVNWLLLLLEFLFLDSIEKPNNRGKR